LSASRPLLLDPSDRIASASQNVLALHDHFVMRLSVGEPKGERFPRGPKENDFLEAKFRFPTCDDNADDSTAESCPDRSKATQQSATKLEKVFCNCWNRLSNRRHVARSAA
jgi:hypothetical protein